MKNRYQNKIARLYWPERRRGGPAKNKLRAFFCRRITTFAPLAFALLKRAAGLRHRNGFFGRNLAFFPEYRQPCRCSWRPGRRSATRRGCSYPDFSETCKFLVFDFYLHVYIITMNFYAGFSRRCCIFIHNFSLPSPLDKIMWYLQPFSDRKAGLLQ